MSAHTLSRGGIALFFVLNFGGCTLIFYPFQSDPPWDPPTLSKEGCPNIEGEYRNVIGNPYRGNGNGLLIGLTRFFDKPYGTVEGKTIPLSEVRILPPKPHSANYLEMEVVKAKQLTLDRDSREWKILEKKRQELWTKIYRNPEYLKMEKKREEEYKQSRARIERRGQTLEVTRHTVADNPPRFKKVLDLNHPLVSCRDGALVIRGWKPWRLSAEFACPWMEAWEYEFRKLPDGTLVVREDEKRWSCSILGGPNWRSQGIYLFPPASKETYETDKPT
jgi:hypothetical protein